MCGRAWRDAAHTIYYYTPIIERFLINHISIVPCAIYYGPGPPFNFPLQWTKTGPISWVNPDPS